jgi:hypothetical protein
MYEPKCKASDRINAAEALLNRGYGKATQLFAPSEQRGSGFTEIKLVIIDTARSPQNAGLEQRSENASIIEHVDPKHDDTALDPILIEAKARD